MAIRINYGQAEKMSFQLCPETCPVIEAAFQKARQHEFKMDEVQAYLTRHGGMQLNDRTKMLLSERLGACLFEPLKELEDIVLHRGTFKLRAAFVNYIAEKEGYQKINHFQGWVVDWENRMSWRESQ